MDTNRTEFLIFQAWKLRLLMAALAVAVAVSAWSIYRLVELRGIGPRDEGGDVAELRAERDRLRSRVDQLETRNADLERQLVVVERSRQLDAEAYAVFNKEHSGLQEEISGLREELAFYRGILAPSGDKVGLQAQDFDVAAGPDGGYRFSLVLTQAGGKEQVARGAARLIVEGRQDGAMRRLALSELTSDGDTEIAYRFRYFQTLGGELHLPEGFQPERVLVRAVPASAPRLPLEWTFDWPAATVAPAGEG